MRVCVCVLLVRVWGGIRGRGFVDGVVWGVWRGGEVACDVGLLSFNEGNGKFNVVGEVFGVGDICRGVFGWRKIK